jgi:3'(2'), 5'-bisphosphate nucleotidase
MNDRARLLDHLLEITVAAASEILKVYQTDFGVDYKSPQDPVTDADRRANALISARLLELMPDVPVVAEESEPGSFARFRESERIFFVDPLDGTRDFVARNGEFVVMIGLVEGTRATVGVVHAPVRGISWAASLGLGAFRVARDGTRTPISVSTTDDPAKAKLVVSRSRRDRDVERAIQLLHVAAAESLGSAGLKGVRVASGSADAYLALNVARLPKHDSAQPGRAAGEQRSTARHHRPTPHGAAWPVRSTRSDRPVSRIGSGPVQVV